MTDSSFSLPSFAPSMEEELKKLPRATQVEIQEEIITSMHLGLLTMVVKNLKKQDKEKFEKVMREMTEADLFFFAYAHVPNFHTKYGLLLEKIAKSLVVTMEKEKPSNG